ncbi:FAD binding domain-containing protein [Xylariomycetidae sp. FL2044]|nr:FAD binding domain-containing protein [Xylariomycetidae sp. FL2044]
MSRLSSGLVYSMRRLILLGLSALPKRANSAKFPFEAITLSEEDITFFPALSFGNRTATSPIYTGPECKASPDSPLWPPESEWALLGASLGADALLKPVPPAAACYPGPDQDAARCAFLVQDTSSNRFYIDDPLTVLTEWPEGDTCYATLTPPANVTCTQGGFPVYVVNVSSVRQVQMAVNFARNRDLRLVVKNTGHDFVGRSVGFGSLSIWTHWLKDFEFLPEFSIGEYEGMAARVGSGIESWEMFARMEEHNMTAVVAGGYTVGAYGGWMAGGGHSAMASTYGMGSDQVLSLEVVTADGRFVTADVNQNTDLFYALRGGGGSTYGIVTSAIVKVHPPTPLLMSTLAFSTGGPANVTSEIFWRAFDIYHAFGLPIVDAGGTAYSNVRKSGDDSFSFTTNIEMPGLSAEQLIAFVQPLYDDLNAIGIPATNPAPARASNWGAGNGGVGDRPGSSRFGSRLFPRGNFEDPTLFARTQRAIRDAVSAGGYAFHGIHLAPTRERAGYPGRDSGVNEAFRGAVLFADLFDGARLRGLTAAEDRAAHARFRVYLDGIRDAAPSSGGGGSYYNECDVEEPDWQRAFFGAANYERLRAVKREWDPWGVFYAPAAVGSEDWEVRSLGGLPRQDGRLCRVGG